MFEDDLPQKIAKPHALGAKLDTLSIVDLRELLEMLDAEKERVSAELKRKQGAVGGAEALFRR